MRAVNLMPRDAHSGPGSAAAGSGAGVYVVIAGLAALVVCTALWAVANRQLNDRSAKLATANAQAAAAEKRASDAAPYVAFKTLASDRVQTVTTLSTTRFDWAHALREVSRVLPADVWLTGMSGASGAGAEAPSPSTSAAPAPTITLLGCTRSQAKVARLMARLRTIDGVRKISLRSSAKPDSKGDESCPANRASDPRFTMAISFAVPGAPKDRVDATGQVVPSSGVPAPSAAPAPSTSATASSTASVVSDGKDG